MRISDWSSDVCSSDLTTIATNTLIERSGSKIGVIVTEGFRDILSIARLRVENPFSLNTGRLPPLVPRERVLAVRERIGPEGDRKRVVSGKSVYVRVDLGGRRIINKKQTKVGRT